MRTFVASILCLPALGCGGKPTESPPMVPVGKVDLPSAPTGSNARPSPSPIANLPFGDLWARGEPKPDLAKDFAAMLARQQVVNRDPLMQAITAIGLGATGVRGPLLSSVSTTLYPRIVESFRKNLGIAFDVAAPQLPLLSVSFDGFNSTHTKRLVFKSTVPPEQLAARVEEYAKLLAEEAKKAGAMSIEMNAVTEPRAGFAISYATDSRAGAISVTAAKPEESTEQVIASLGPVTAIGNVNFASNVGVEKKRLAIVIVEERQK